MPAYYSQPAPRPGGESVFQDATCRIAVYAPYLVLCAAPDSGLSPGAVTGVRRGLEQLGQMRTHIGYVVVHEAPFRLGMAPEVRTGLTLAMQRFEDQIGGLAVVYEESGLKAAAIRSLVAAQHATSRSKHPCKVFDEAQPALTWLSSLLPDAKVSLGDLGEFVREQRRRLLMGTPVPSSAPLSRR